MQEVSRIMYCAISKWRRCVEKIDLGVIGCEDTMAESNNMCSVFRTLCLAKFEAKKV